MAEAARAFFALDLSRVTPKRFAEHYNQATLFWKSQSAVEKAHIIRGFRFELTKVQVPAVRERVVAMLANVDRNSATDVAIVGEASVPKDKSQPAART